MVKNVLVFDAETTGLPPKDAKYETDFMRFPHIVQLAWCMDGVEKDYIIKPEGWIIPEETTAIHGITTDHALKVGRPFGDVCNEFIADCERADFLVAHNIYFDTSTIKANVLKMFHIDYLEQRVNPAMDKYKRIDTMMKTIKFVGATFPNSAKLKFPKLEELYYKLFGEDFPAHNAIEDVRAIIRCLPELVAGGIIEFKKREPIATAQKLDFTDPNPVTEPIGCTPHGPYRLHAETPSEPNNAGRSRHYGLQVDDVVDAKDVRGMVVERCVVVELMPMDNNGVILKNEAGKVFEWTAEWCEIVPFGKILPYSEPTPRAENELLGNDMDEF